MQVISGYAIAHGYLDTGRISVFRIYFTQYNANGAPGLLIRGHLITTYTGGGGWMVYAYKVNDLFLSTLFVYEGFCGCSKKPKNMST